MYRLNDSIDNAHIYQLEGNQHIRFMKKQNGRLVYTGTTNEELIEVLIDRISKMNEKVPTFDNMQAIACLGGALNHLNNRTQKRIELGIEGTDQ